MTVLGAPIADANRLFQHIKQEIVIRQLDLKIGLACGEYCDSNFC